MGRERLPVGILHQSFIRARVPQRKRQDPHQRPVAVIPLSARPRVGRQHALAQTAEGVAGLAADVENTCVDCVGPAIRPGQQTPAEIVKVELAKIEERGKERQCLGAIVGPGARRRAIVGTAEACGRLELYLVQWRNLFPRVELVGHAQSIADEQPK